MGDTLIESLLGPRFQRLKPYFEGVIFQDLACVTEIDIVNGVKNEDKLLMTVFLRTHLGKALQESRNQHPKHEEDDESDSAPIFRNASNTSNEFNLI